MAIKFDLPEDSELMQEAYFNGFFAAALGLELQDNPYEPSGHERDTTIADECRYTWDRGYSDYHEGTWKVLPAYTQLKKEITNLRAELLELYREFYKKEKN